MLGEAFDMCIACSEPVINAFKGEDAQAFQFLLNACNKSGFLEEFTGLAGKLSSMKMEEIEDFEFEEFEETEEKE